MGILGIDIGHNSFGTIWAWGVKSMEQYCQEAIWSRNIMSIRHNGHRV